MAQAGKKRNFGKIWLNRQNADAGKTLSDLFQSASDGPDRLKQHVQGMTRHGTRQNFIGEQVN